MVKCLSVLNKQPSCQNCEYIGESPISSDHCESCRNFSNYKKKDIQTTSKNQKTLKEFYTIEFSFHYYDEKLTPCFQYDNETDALKMYEKIYNIVKDKPLESEIEWLNDQFDQQGCYGYIDHQKPINLVKTTINKEIIK